MSPGTFANLLVRRRAGPTTPEAVTQLLKRHVRSRGWVEVPGHDVVPPRGIAVFPAGDWIAVYDTAIEQFDGPKELGELARVLSLTSGELVLSTRVSTSDYFSWAFYERGEIVCEVERTADGCALPRKALAALLRRFPGADPRALSRVLAKDEFRVQDNLAAAADVLQLPSAILAGHGGAAPALLTAALRFGLSPRASAPAERPSIEGIAADDVDCAVGEEVTWDPSYRNFGAACRGLRLELSGDAISSGLVTPASARLRLGGIDLTGEFRRKGAGMILELSGAEVPAGLAKADLDRWALVSFKAWTELAMPTLLWARVVLVGARAGTGTLTLTICSAAGGEAIGHSVRCTVAPQVR